MATTTNYGWATPDDTALVKDGAAAIRTLGSSIDTSVKSLNAGTTAGDLDYYTSATAKARIAIGTNGQVLTSNGSVPSWATPASGGMTLISTTTLSGASVTLSSIPQTYNSLQLIISGITGALNTWPRIQPNGTASILSSNQIVAGSASQANNSELDIAGGYVLATGGANVFSILIENYSSGTYFKPVTSIGRCINNSSAIVNTSNFGAFTTTTAITSLVISSFVNTFSAGQVLLYGVK